MPYANKSPLAAAYQFHRLATGYGPGARNAPYALKLARADVAAGKARYPFTAVSGRPWGGVSWQADKPGLAHVDNPESHGFRLVGEVNSEPRGGDWWNTRGKSGWIADPYGDYSLKSGWGLCWGVVYQLPGRRGTSRFVAGYVFGDTDGGPTLDLGTVYSEAMGGDWGYCSATDLDAARDAARAANHMAEQAAERERLYQAAASAGARWAELGDEIRDMGKTLNAMVRDCRKARALASDFPAIRDAMAARYAGLLSDIRKARAKRDKLKSGDIEPLYFYPGDKESIDAFNESAGSTVL